MGFGFVKYLSFIFWDRKFKNKKVGGMWGAGRLFHAKLPHYPKSYPRVLDLGCLRLPAAAVSRNFNLFYSHRRDAISSRPRALFQNWKRRPSQEILVPAGTSFFDTPAQVFHIHTGAPL